MSVLIRNMEMPKDCRECPLMEYHMYTGKTWCKPADGLLAEDYKPISFDGRPEWCPLEELPKKHGRLVDVNVIKDKMIPLSFSVQNWISEVALDTEVPTVIDKG